MRKTVFSGIPIWVWLVGPFMYLGMGYNVVGNLFGLYSILWNNIIVYGHSISPPRVEYCIQYGIFKLKFQ